MLSNVAFQTKIDSDVTTLMKAAHCEAASLAIVDHGTIVYQHGYGLRDRERALPADADTRYEIGSITKQFTAAAILQLKEARKIELDAPLATYLPGAPHAKDVTIRQLLAQTSGFQDYITAPNIEKLIGTPITFDRLMARIAYTPLDFKPGTQWEYSSTNYLILGRVVQVVSGQAWEDYAKEHLFAAAGMANTSTIADEERQPDMARGYIYAKGQTMPSTPLDETWASSAGGVVSTVGDLEKWNEALTAGRIVTTEDYRLLTTPQALADGSSTEYGFGLYIDSFEGQPRIWHSGNTFGFDGSNQFFPKQGVRIIVLTNAADGGSDEIVARIYNDLFPTIATAALAFTGVDPAAALSKQFTLRAHAISADMTPMDIYRSALATMRSVRAPAYLQFHIQVTSDYHGDVVIQNFKHVERTADRAEKITDVDVELHRNWRPFQFVPDLFLGHADIAKAAPESDPFSAGLDAAGDKPLNTIGTVAATVPRYKVTLSGIEDLPRCGTAVHLKLEPLRTPEVNNLRDLWIDPKTSRICRAVGAWYGRLNYARAIGLATLYFGTDGLIHGYSMLATAHIVVGTDSIRHEALYKNIRLADESVWTAATDTYRH